MLVILIGMMLSFGNTAAVAKFSLSVADGPIPVQLGSSATLPCQLNPPLNAASFKVSWCRTDEAKTPVLFYENQQVKETSADPLYRGRGSLVGDLEKGDVSLKLENLTRTDRGEYTCFVKSDLWYEKASVSLNMKVVGSVPLLSYTVVDKDQLNVTCVSDGWSPQPTLTWRNRKGREINDNPVCEYTTDADDLVSVGSWLLVSPSNSDWISCSVHLSDQEMEQGRVLPQITRTQAETVPLSNTSDGWKAAFITIIVLVLLGFSLLFFSYKKGFRYTKISKSNETVIKERPPCTGKVEMTEEKTADTGKHEQKPPTTECGTNTDAPVIAEKSTMSDAQIVKIPELKTVKGNEVQLTLDSEMAPPFMKVGNNGKSVTCSDPEEQAAHGDHHPHVLCKERLSSHQHYWEVRDYYKSVSNNSENSNSKPKLTPLQDRQSWYMGVCTTTAAESKDKLPLTPENGFWVLRFQKEKGFFANTDPEIMIQMGKSLEILGVNLDCEKHTLSFYNTLEETHGCTFYNIPPLNTLVPLLCPGVKDGDCMYISEYIREAIIKNTGDLTQFI